MCFPPTPAAIPLSPKPIGPGAVLSSQVLRKNFTGHSAIRRYLVEVLVSCLLREYKVGTGATIANQLERFRQRFSAAKPHGLAVLDREDIQGRDHSAHPLFTTEPFGSVDLNSVVLNNEAGGSAKSLTDFFSWRREKLLIGIRY